MNIEGRTAIITGASSGIGGATAREFASRGASVVLASRNREALEALADEIGGARGRPLVVPTDVTDRFAVEALLRRAVEEFDSVDILVNNAGSGLFASLAEGSVENMRRLFEVNLWGAVHCIQAALPYMRSQRRGHIVNVASVAGKVAVPFLGAYSASKFALAAISDALRAELAGTGVSVSTIYPGLTETSFLEHSRRELDIPDPPPFARFVRADAVARRIAQAVRWNLRDAYVSPEDVLAVGLHTLAPPLVDWAMRLWMGSPGPVSSPSPTPAPAPRDQAPT